MKRQRIRQPVIAAALGLSQASVSRKLTGHTPLTVDELAVVADVLGVDLVELVKAA
jgi:transcriptional regulator with XRE-family HTH domain